MTNLIHVHIADRYANEPDIEELVGTRSASRLRAGDPQLWGPAAREAASERLGWVDAPGNIHNVIEQAHSLREHFSGLNYEQVLLCGMGGSSLSPQVMAHGAPLPLVAVDTVHPDAVDDLCRPDSLLRSLIIVSSKSGGTVETRAQLALCEARLRDAGADPTERILIITDPDSQLHAYAWEQGYTVVLGNPLVGGRYSALTVFGIVPSVLAGATLTNFATDAQASVTELAHDTLTNPALKVAAALAKATMETGTIQVVADGHTFLPEWIEQLIAESTGKDGRGLLPIPRTHDSATATGGMLICVSESHSDHRCDADVSVRAPLVAQFYFWEVVTALVCVFSNVNPFDQPDVEHTKQAAREMDSQTVSHTDATELSPGIHLTRSLGDRTPVSLEDYARTWVQAASEATYVAIQAFTPKRNPLIVEIGELTERIAQVPCAVSYGPEYLHSTGQLHKGGQPGGLFLNILHTAHTDVEVPGSSSSFGWLLASASIADQAVLAQRGRSVTGMRIANEKMLEPFVQHLRLLADTTETRE